MKYEIKCGFCGEHFESSKSTAQYCSDNCRVKYHKAKKKQDENTENQVQLPVQQSQQDNQHILLEQQRAELIQINNALLSKAKHAQDKKRHCSNVIRDIGLKIKYTQLQIKEDAEKQKRLREQLSLNQKKEIALQKIAEKKASGIDRLEAMLAVKKISKEAPGIEKEIEGLYQKISGQKRKLIKLSADLEVWKERLNTLRKNLNKFRNWFQSNQKKVEVITDRLYNPNPAKVNNAVLSESLMPKRIIAKTASSGKSIGAGDLQHINFKTFHLPGELGSFLGELDRNKTSFALTGDSGAGKSWFSFAITRLFIVEMGFRVKYFSLEEGLGKLTQKKVAAFGLGNELNLTGTGSIEDVRLAAKQYPMVVVDSFNSLDAKAEEFERLRTDFPKTIFLLIFQKTTAGTIRGGSAIKYNSSATINVIKRKGKRIAIMEKGRYGTIGWEYSITENRVIKKGE